MSKIKPKPYKVDVLSKITRKELIKLCELYAKEGDYWRNKYFIDITMQKDPLLKYSRTTK